MGRSAYEIVQQASASRQCSRTSRRYAHWHLTPMGASWQWAVKTLRCRSGNSSRGNLWQHCPVTQAACVASPFEMTGLVLASADDDHMIYLWNVLQRFRIRSVQGHTNRIWSLAFVPKSHMLISGSEDDTLRWWHTETGDCLRTLRGYTDLIKSVAWNPDGTMLVSGSEDETVRLWDTVAGTGVRVA